MIRNHIAWSEALARKLAETPDFRLVTRPMLSLFSFRHEPEGIPDLDAHNQRLVQAINDDGRIYLTQTRVDETLAIRFQVGQFDCTQSDVDTAYDVLCSLARSLQDGQG